MALSAIHAGDPQVYGADNIGVAVTCASALAQDELDRCSDLELLDLVQLEPRDSPVGSRACQLLVEGYRSLVRACSEHPTPPS